jgi:hypothetical protein
MLVVYAIGKDEGMAADLWPIQSAVPLTKSYYGIWNNFSLHLLSRKALSLNTQYKAKWIMVFLPILEGIIFMVYF